MNFLCLKKMCLFRFSKRKIRPRFFRCFCAFYNKIVYNMPRKVYRMPKKSYHDFGPKILFLFSKTFFHFPDCRTTLCMMHNGSGLLIYKIKMVISLVNITVSIIFYTMLFKYRNSSLSQTKFRRVSFLWI